MSHTLGASTKRDQHVAKKGEKKETDGAGLRSGGGVKSFKLGGLA